MFSMFQQIAHYRKFYPLNIFGSSVLDTTSQSLNQFDSYTPHFPIDSLYNKQYRYEFNTWYGFEWFISTIFVSIL